MYELFVYCILCHVKQYFSFILTGKGERLHVLTATVRFLAVNVYKNTKRVNEITQIT